ncbi:uncharacterized protein SCHCODRAFT_02583404 [Schizophyllum commune H4-8]|nr:uncharacterized protein SCHCODRAFT_02583404 [Schizophyllum commune H4-8]KAI5890407.1 hypothetical protein SCHCODRAFT_02583404 [Schizophyllum commune H4-8]
MSASFSHPPFVYTTSYPYGVGVCAVQCASESAAMPFERLDGVGVRVRVHNLEVGAIARNEDSAPYTSWDLLHDCASYGTCPSLSPAHLPARFGDRPVARSFLLGDIHGEGLNGEQGV